MRCPFGGFRERSSECSEASASTPFCPHRDIPALTELRSLAAFSVAVAHRIDVSFRIDNRSAFFSAIELWLVQIAGFGMTLFFVLSCFVIHHNYRGLIRAKKAVGFFEFPWARFSRLYQLFALILVADLLVGPRFYDSMVSDPRTAVASILNVLPHFRDHRQSGADEAPRCERRPGLDRRHGG
jgi:peptidoglycan/LPS O-acetylase OafA/YrhL